MKVLGGRVLMPRKTSNETFNNIKKLKSGRKGGIVEQKGAFGRLKPRMTMISKSIRFTNLNLLKGVVKF